MGGGGSTLGTSSSNALNISASSNGNGTEAPPPSPTASAGSGVVAPAVPGDSLGASSTIVLKRTSAKALAVQMTILDADTFGEIKPEEMLLGNWTRPNKEEGNHSTTHLSFCCLAHAGSRSLRVVCVP
jgi:Mrp family chromosome partitioning ATPase